MARSPMVRIPGDPPRTAPDGDGEPEARTAPENSVGDVTERTPTRAEARAAELVDTSAALPDVADVDVTTITRAVLTKQGWLCPLPENDALGRGPAQAMR